MARLNGVLLAEGAPYALIGVGRWGSRDPWLGIPVTWDQIAGARVIVEAGLRDLKVTPSQGTHFFQNLTSFNVGYFTVNPEAGDGSVDWEWLEARPPSPRRPTCGTSASSEPILVLMNGRKNEGVILKGSDLIVTSQSDARRLRQFVRRRGAIPRTRDGARVGERPISRRKVDRVPGGQLAGEPLGSRSSRRVGVISWVAGSRPQTYSPGPIIFHWARHGSSAARQRRRPRSPGGG